MNVSISQTLFRTQIEMKFEMHSKIKNLSRLISPEFEYYLFKTKIIQFKFISYILEIYNQNFNTNSIFKQFKWNS